jgi:hypothetical protein
MRLFYDIGELGHSIFLAAHIRYLYEQGEKVAIATSKAKEVMYRGIVDRWLPIPQEYYERFEVLLPSNHGLFDPVKKERLLDHSIISQPFIIKYADEYDVVTEYSKRYNHLTIFEPYKHSESAEELARHLFRDKRIIVVFPRGRQSVFKCRNIDIEYWEQIIDSLCQRFDDYLVLSSGTKQGAFSISSNHENYYNFVGYNPDVTLDVLVALCNTGRAVATIGNQSAPPTISLLCGTPSYMFGHHNHLHTVEKNWKNTPAGFWELEFPEEEYDADHGYIVHDFEGMLRDILDFVQHHTDLAETAKR